MIPKIVGEEGGAGPGDHAVSTGVFRERGRLEDGAPCGVDVAVDDRLWPDPVGVVFFFPAADKGIVQPRGEEGMDFHGFGKGNPRLFAGDAGDVYPVATRTDFLQPNGHMPAVRHHKGIAVPEIGNQALLLGQDLGRVINFFGQQVKVTGAVHGVRGRRPGLKLGQVGQVKRADGLPLRIDGPKVRRRRGIPSAWLLGRGVAREGAELAISVTFAVGQDLLGDIFGVYTAVFERLGADPL